MGRRWIMVAVLLVTALSLGGRSALAQDGSGPLAQMLNQIPDNQVSRTVIWYGSLSDLERVLGFQLNSLQDFQKLPKQQQTGYLLDVSTHQIYYSGFSGIESPDDWRKTFGIDTFNVDREVTVGTAPNWYGVLQGTFDPAAVTQALQTLGYQQSQIGSAAVFSLGGDNASDPNNAANRIADALYNRLSVSGQRIIAAPSTAMIQAATAGNPIGSDAGYKALVRTLEGQNTVPGTTLVSAALYNGPFLSSTAAKVGNEPTLPRYQVAGVGYRRDATNRYWVIALVYPDADSANKASAILADRLPRYVGVSGEQAGRKLFEGWKISAKVTPSDQFQVVTVSMQLPAQTDVALTGLLQARDIGFLATDK